ncbi:helix-turn-helix domain-containing protein [Nocardioides kongjuensis]|uniref:Transcriptional regulator with XRE-family HTH domain n=1 Tax=Nocardioides kongjuensis TaxID=349522 RepID=A0A852RTN9_9ACTN|nr:helix-turn-helix transcriptional regulator [Nocardioides kongjuensis]NYD33878.1 transcriptional regulator with XRE-family HTH domain [Nocardioides kongjuensis]
MTKTPTALTGANVRAEMARQDVSQTELAAKVGLSQTGLSKRLRGAIPFDVNELAAVAAELHVSIDQLTAGIATTEGATA